MWAAYIGRSLRRMVMTSTLKEPMMEVVVAQHDVEPTLEKAAGEGVHGASKKTP